MKYGEVGRVQQEYYQFKALRSEHNQHSSADIYIIFSTSTAFLFFQESFLIQFSRKIYVLKLRLR